MKSLEIKCYMLLKSFKWDRLSVSSFDREAIREFKKSAPHIE
jgi:hypothetical protein